MNEHYKELTDLHCKTIVLQAGEFVIVHLQKRKIPPRCLQQAEAQENWSLENHQENK